MILILKRIGATTLVPHIEEFIAPALIGGFFKKHGRLENITIQMMVQAGSEKAEYHALVRVEPDPVAVRAVKMLNRKPLNGKYINVAEYIFRHRDNDRRLNRYKPLDNRRKSNRRRLHLEITDITEQRRTPIIDKELVTWKADVTL